MVQNFSKIKNIKISTQLHDELRFFKNFYKCTTFEELFRVFIDRAKYYEKKEEILKARENDLKKIEKDFKSKNDFINKRLVALELRYFVKISDLYSNHEVGVKEILQAITSIKKTISENQNSVGIYTDPEYIELKKQFNDLWSENSDNKLKLKSQDEKIQMIADKFERKSTLMATIYEARLSPQEYEKVFQS